MITITNKHRPWFARGLFFSNTYFSISVGLYFRAFGVMIKKNGGSLDFNISLFLVYFSLTFWDRGMRKIISYFKK